MRSSREDNSPTSCVESWHAPAGIGDTGGGREVVLSPIARLELDYEMAQGRAISGRGTYEELKAAQDAYFAAFRALK